MFFEPFHGISDTSAVYKADADAADRSADVKHPKRVRPRVRNPGDRNQHGAGQNERPWTETIRKIGLEWHQPGLKNDKEREGHLDGGPAPMVFGVNGIDEYGPAVLQVGHHGHANNSRCQLDPALRSGARGGGVRRWCAFCRGFRTHC